MKRILNIGTVAATAMLVILQTQSLRAQQSAISTVSSGLANTIGQYLDDGYRIEHFSVLALTGRFLMVLGKKGHYLFCHFDVKNAPKPGSCGSINRKPN